MAVPLRLRPHYSLSIVPGCTNKTDSSTWHSRIYQSFFVSLLLATRSAEYDSTRRFSFRVVFECRFNRVLVFDVVGFSDKLSMDICQPTTTSKCDSYPFLDVRVDQSRTKP